MVKLFYNLWICTDFIYSIFISLSVVKLCNFFILQPTGNAKSQSILITPGNVHYFANFIRSGATMGSQSIRFGHGTLYEKLLQVPIAAAGELDAHASIRVTVGLTPVSGDSDPRIGISDGSNENKFFVVDSGNYRSYPPCYVIDGSHENNRVTTRRVSSQFTFLFSPFYKYGACSSAQDGGYLNVGTFNKQVDPTNGIDLVIYRNHAPENYKFRYFLVEIL